MKVLFLLFCYYAYGSPHNITRFEVPDIVDPRDTAELFCSYRMGGEALHSVKWYQNNDEIFRYSPGEEPTTRTFNGTGLTSIAGDCRRDVCKLMLTFQRGAASKHSYKCEVSTERPRFAVVQKFKDMIVAVIPTSGPTIKGAPNAMYPNQEAILNCTTGKSLPEMELTWYIDGMPEKPDPRWPIRTTDHSPPDSDGLRQSWRLLHLRAKSHGVGSHHVRCEASISIVPELFQNSFVKIPVNSHAHISKLTGCGSISRPNSYLLLLAQSIFCAILLTIQKIVHCLN